MKKIKKVKHFNYCNERKEKGITIVALVVTIIILLILTGVTLNLALSDNGLIEKTKEAVEKYKQAEDEEENAIDKMSDKLEKLTIDYNDYVGCYVEGYKPTKKDCTITSVTSGVNAGERDENNTVIEGIDENGDQKFTTEEGMKWRIWDYDENTRTIRLISEKPTKAKLTLKGAAGYNNGVWAINEICRQCYGQYDNNGKMKEEIDVANLRRSDIQKVIKYDYTKYIYEVDENNKYKYGDVMNYDKNGAKYPKMWSNNDKNWSYKNNNGTIIGTDKEGLIWEVEGNNLLTGYEQGDNKTNFKQSKWIYEYDKTIAKEEDWVNTKYFYLVFGDKDGDFVSDYWLGCRCVYLTKNACAFGIQAVYPTQHKYLIAGPQLFTSIGDENCVGDRTIRPVVSINLGLSGLSLKKITDNDKNTSFILE